MGTNPKSFLFNFIHIHFYKNKNTQQFTGAKDNCLTSNVKVLVQNPATFKLIINIVSNKGPKNTTLNVKAMMALVAKHTLVADKAGTEV